MKAKTLVKTSDLSHQEWLDYRKQGIGGSDAACILNMSPYRSPLMVYAEKISEAKDTEDNEAMRIGRDLEEYVASRFTEQTGKKVRRLNAILQHPEKPFMLANVDRLVVGEQAGLECKTTSLFNKSDFQSGEVPPNYYWQCQHYMAVTGLAKWYLAVLVMGKSFHVIEIERNDEHIAVLTVAEAEFWGRVERKDPPYPTGLEGESEVLGDMYPAREGAKVLDDEFIEPLRYYLELKEEKKALEQRLDAQKNTILMAMEGFERASVGGFKISNSERTTKRIDTAELKKLYPDLAQQFSKVSTSRTFTVKEV